MLIDTHAHLWWDSYAKDLDQVLSRAKNAGVEKIIVPGVDVESSKAAIALAKRYPKVIYAAVGIHPEEVENQKHEIQNTKQILRTETDEIRNLIRANREYVVAVGEVGMDIHNAHQLPMANVHQLLEKQRELLREQCKLAQEFNLPVIVHSREAVAEALSALDEVGIKKAQFHCFSGTEEELAVVLERGYYVSFCANITWSKRVARLVPLVPEDRLLTETDSPFMKPKQRNEPSQVAELIGVMASLRGVERGALVQAVETNAIRLYHV